MNANDRQRLANGFWLSFCRKHTLTAAMHAEEGRSQVTVGNDRAFTFDHVFGPTSQQVCAAMSTTVWSHNYFTLYLYIVSLKIVPL